MSPGVGKDDVLVPEEPKDIQGTGLRAELGERCHCPGICLNFLSFTKVKSKCVSYRVDVAVLDGSLPKRASLSEQETSNKGLCGMSHDESQRLKLGSKAAAEKKKMITSLEL